jgi:hypothetical protein
MRTQTREAGTTYAERLLQYLLNPIVTLMAHKINNSGGLELPCSARATKGPRS